MILILNDGQDEFEFERIQFGQERNDDGTIFRKTLMFTFDNSELISIIQNMEDVDKFFESFDVKINEDKTFLFEDYFLDSIGIYKDAFIKQEKIDLNLSKNMFE